MDAIGRRYAKRLAKDVDHLEAHIDVTFKANPFRSLRKRFVIAASPRTGSTLLCERLLAHGAVVAESLLPVHVIRACRNRHGLGLEGYCQNYLRWNAPNGVFGVKGWPPLLVPLVLSGEFPAHLGDWKFVFLRREDTLSQAISRIIANETLAWQSGREPTKSLTDADFDAGKIARMVQLCTRDNQAWNEYFDLFGLDPLRITYEDLSADADGVASRVAAYLELDGPPVEGRRSAGALEVQATSLNARWKARYLEQTGPTA